MANTTSSFLKLTAACAQFIGGDCDDFGKMAPKVAKRIWNTYITGQKIDSKTIIRFIEKTANVREQGDINTVRLLTGSDYNPSRVGPRTAAEILEGMIEKTINLANSVTRVKNVTL